jgi:plastocyanin
MKGSHRFLLRAPLALLAAASLPAAAQTGTIAGKVEATPAKYLDETVVYVVKAAGTFTPKAHTMDQKGLKFLPHVMVITKGDTVGFLNHDNVAHNVYSPDGTPYNLGTFKPNEEAKHAFDETGAYSQLCSIHPEMLAYIYVNQNPYAAAVDAKGHYVIKDVPAGSYQLGVWNSHLKAAPKPVTVTAGKTTDVNFDVKR